MSVNSKFDVRRQFHEMRHTQVRRIMDTISGAVGFRKSTVLLSECDYPLLMEALADFEKKVAAENVTSMRLELVDLYREL